MSAVACMLLGAASEVVQADAGREDIAATVEIRAHQRSLQARYTLPAPVQRLPLKRDYSSELRQRVWKIRTPGVRLDGSALVGERPFTEVEIAAEALTEPVPKDYAPLAPFSDGGVAVYTGLFDAGDGKQRTRYRFVPARGDRVVLFGRAQASALEWTSEADGDGTYVYFGRSTLVPSGAGLAVLDRALPGWIADEVDAEFPRLIGHYTERFGRAAPFTPFVLFSFNGSDVGGTHSQGSVLPGLLYMRLDGSAWSEASDANRAGLRWTLAHEAAHFWNLSNRDADGAQWMHEGSADAFAYRALQALGHLDAAAVADQDDAALARCLLDLGDRSVRAAERDSDVAYSCGLVMARYTEAVLRRRDASADLHTFWRALLDASGDDGYTQALYLATLAALTGEPRATAWLAEFADRRDENLADLATAFARVGIPLDRLDGAPGAEAARKIAGKLMWPLMAADCGGRISITTRVDALRLHGGSECATLKQDIDVRSIEGHALFGDPVAAHAQAAQRCQAREPVRLGDGQRELALPCAVPIEALPALFRFPRPSAAAQPLSTH